MYNYVNVHGLLIICSSDATRSSHPDYLSQIRRLLLSGHKSQSDFEVKYLND